MVNGNTLLLLVLSYLLLNRISKFFQNDSLGCNSVSWAPYQQLPSTSLDVNTYRLATGSCDNMVRIWKCTEGNGDGNWFEEAKTIDTPHKGKHNGLDFSL
jgi:WD40 repeat protein